MHDEFLPLNPKNKTQYCVWLTQNSFKMYWKEILMMQESTKKPHNALVKNERNKTHFLLYTPQYRYQYFNEYEFYSHYFIVNLRYREFVINQMSGQ